jgi:PAS domain S-box-containing protein
VTVRGSGTDILDEPQEIIRAIRLGEVDAFVVEGPQGETIYTLRSADLLYRKMVEEMQEGAVALDATGLVLFCNACFARMVKCERAAIVGRTIAPFLPGGAVGVVQALAEDSMARTTREEMTLRASDGTQVPTLVTMNRIAVEDSDVFCLIVRDLTESKRREELLAHSRRKDEFLAMLAHELRNPLAPIRNAVEILALKDSLDPQLAWVRGVIDRQVTQLTRLVEDLLDVSRIATGKIRLELAPVDVAVVAAGAVEAARPTMEARRQELSVGQTARALRVRADGARLAQVISNLLNNAAKFTPEGGRIRLTIDERDGWATIAVRDNGIGIAPDMLPKVFDLFTQCDSSDGRAQGGLGIGLTLVRNLVEMQGGHVQVSSDGAGQGSEFVVRLPLLGEATPRAPAAAAAVVPARADTGLRILIIDDNVDAAESLEVLLRGDGHDVRICHDGHSGVEVACAFRPHIVFLDIGLPGMNGYDTARELRRVPEIAGATLVALTGYAREEDRRVSHEVGIDRHWLKPIDLDSLKELLASVAAR